MVRAAFLLFVTLPLAAQQSPQPQPSPQSQQPISLPGYAPVAPGQSISTGPFKIISPITQPTLTPGQITLIELEGRFQEEVKAGGGKVFSTWFAEDAVALNNGKPAVLGRSGIAASAQWNPAEYQLLWIPQGAQMGPSGDMGFTWGHYSTSFQSPDGKPIVTSGRYITIWKKLKDGTWKVAMDASADDVPNPGECCTLPKP